MPQTGQYSLADVGPKQAGQGQFSLADVGAQPPAPPSYLSEAISGVGRGLSNLAGGLKQFYEYNKNLPGGIAQGVAQDLWRGVTRAGEASEQAKRQGEGTAGQTLTALENYPVIGGMVQKAEQAGPGYAKMSPQTIGAATEALTTFEGPQAFAKALSAAHAALPSIPRAGQAIGIIKDRIGTVPSGGMDGLGFQKANAEMNGLTSTGQPVPGPLRAFVEGVQQGSAGSLNIDNILGEMDKTDPKLAGKLRAQLAAEEATSGPPRPNAGVVDPNTFAGLAKFRTILNSWKYDRSLPEASRNALGHTADAMGQELQQLAEQNGYGKEWSKYQAEYASGKGAIRAAGKYGPVVGQVAGGAIGAIAPEAIPQVQGISARAGAGLAGMYFGARAGEKLGGIAEPITKAIVNRPGTPTIRSVPTNPAAYQDILLSAKEGRITPEEANRRIQSAGGSLKTRRIPQP